MRIISVPGPVAVMRAPGGAEAGKPVAEKIKIRLGWEDILVATAFIVIVVSWMQGVYGPDQVLSHLGFAGAGGVWGYVTGVKKGKK